MKTPMSRSIYKKILGLFYLGCLLAYYLWIFITVVESSGEIASWAMWGRMILFVPINGFLMAAIATLLVWVFLRIMIKVEPLTAEERECALLRRFSYIQLFAFAGTLIFVVLYITFFFTPDFPSHKTYCPIIPGMFLFAFHFVAAALAAFLLYVGARAKYLLLSLLCLPAFIAVYAGDYVAVSIVANDYCQSETKTGVEQADMVQMETIPYDTAWIEQADSSAIRYFKEFGWGGECDSSCLDENSSFSKRILFDYAFFRTSDVSDDVSLLEHGLFKGKDLINLQKLATSIFESGDNSSDANDDTYQVISKKVLPSVLKALNYGNLYRSSGLGELIDLLDYAYYDLQYSQEKKLSLLYGQMDSEQIDWEKTDELLLYFNQPHAMLHKSVNSHVLVWAYSFWARRWADDNIRICRRLLDDILKVYPNTSYTPEKMKVIEERLHHERLQMRQQSKDALLSEIRTSFADVLRPERDEIVISSSGDSERAEIGDKYARYEWADVPQDLLREKQDALHFFTVKAFCYYIPAFLVSIVEDYKTGENMNSTLVWSLTYHWDNAEIQEMQYFRFDALSSEQKLAIYHVLEWLLAEHGDDFINPSDKFSDLWRAIDSWWVRYE